MGMLVLTPGKFFCMFSPLREQDITWHQESYEAQTVAGTHIPAGHEGVVFRKEQLHSFFQAVGAAVAPRHVAMT